jgi:hypothetical protein
MVMHSNDAKRDTLGRTITLQRSPQLDNAHISGDRDSIRAGFVHRFDDRKAAELLNSRNISRPDGPREAPLDSMRMRRGDGMQVAADLFPLNELSPTHRATLTALFENPAVARAYLVHPDRTIGIIGERHPELRGILEANAPFTCKDNVFSVNMSSPMYRSIEMAAKLGAPATATKLYRDLDGLLTSARGTSLGGAAGIETSAYTFLTACVRNGFQSEQAAHAAGEIKKLMKTDRAMDDLQVIAAVIRHQLSREQVLTRAPEAPQLPIYVPRQPQPTPQLRTQAEAVPSPRAVVPPVPQPQPALLQSTPQPVSARVETPVRTPPVAPLSATPQPQATIPRRSENSPAALALGSAPPGPMNELAPMMKPPELAPAARVTMTPTMQRLVDVVNNSTLDRQIGSPRNNPILEFSDRDHETLKKMLTNPVTKQELLGYSDEQLKAGFQAVRPDRIKYLEEWLAMNHRDAQRHPGLARSMAGITPQDTNRIGQVVGIARSVAQERLQ